MFLATRSWCASVETASSPSLWSHHVTGRTSQLLGYLLKEQSRASPVLHFPVVVADTAGWSHRLRCNRACHDPYRELGPVRGRPGPGAGVDCSASLDSTEGEPSRPRPDNPPISAHMRYPGTHWESWARGFGSVREESQGDAVVTRLLANPSPCRLPLPWKRLPNAVSPTEPATTQRRCVAMEPERNRVTPQLFGMSPGSRTPPPAMCQNNLLVRQRCPPVFPLTLFVLVSAQTLHRIPLAIPINRIGTTTHTTVWRFRRSPGD